jgi:hypothetical protein
VSSPFTFPDGSELRLTLEPAMVARRLVPLLCRVIGVTDSRGFALFSARGGVETPVRACDAPLGEIAQHYIV